MRSFTCSQPNIVNEDGGNAHVSAVINGSGYTTFHGKKDSMLMRDRTDIAPAEAAPTGTCLPLLFEKSTAPTTHHHTVSTRDRSAETISIRGAFQDAHDVLDVEKDDSNSLGDDDEEGEDSTYCKHQRFRMDIENQKRHYMLSQMLLRRPLKTPASRPLRQNMGARRHI